MDEWINKAWYIHNEVLINATTWDNLENIMLSEVSRTQKEQVLYDPIHMKSLEQANLQKQKVEWKLPEVGGRRNGELLLHGYNISVWDDENVLEIDSGDSCITLEMFLMSLNSTLRKG